MLFTSYFIHQDKTKKKNLKKIDSRPASLSSCSFIRTRNRLLAGISRNLVK